MAFRQGILGVVPILSLGKRALQSYILSVSNLSVQRYRLRNRSELVEQCCSLVESKDHMGIRKITAATPW